MLKQYPKFGRGQVEKIYKSLSKKEKAIIENYLNYRRARGSEVEKKVKDIRRFILQIRHIIQKEFSKINVDDFRNLFSMINTSYYKDSVRFELKITIKNFLKWLFNDWSVRFNNFEGIKNGNSGINEEKINSKNLFKIEDIEQCMKAETTMYWKAFFITQYEAALRTGETSGLKWSDIKFNVDNDISEINIYATKTKKARAVFVEKGTFYLKQLEEEQKNTNKKSIYCFPARTNLDAPINKSTISNWFRRLTKKALGVERWNYLLRHSRATELYRLAEQGKISKDTAIRFMGHSEDMSKIYTHLNSDEVKQMLKDQVYKLEDIPEEKKHELEKEITYLKQAIKELQAHAISGKPIQLRTLVKEY